MRPWLRRRSATGHPERPRRHSRRHGRVGRRQGRLRPDSELIGSLCGIGCFGNVDQPGMTGSVGLQLSIPLYAGGALGASMRKANLEQIKSEVDALSTRDQVRESAISAWSSLQNATAQIESARSAVASGQLVVDGTVQERDVGQRTTLDVLNAQARTGLRPGGIDLRHLQQDHRRVRIAGSGWRLNPIDLGLNVEVKSGKPIPPRSRTSGRNSARSTSSSSRAACRRPDVASKRRRARRSRLAHQTPVEDGPGRKGLGSQK